ncbi:MAG TPA: histidinol phosphatase [Blastocatellia bacterium]|nr:histidinol phosphatase [Blastocatellia bacterium]
MLKKVWLCALLLGAGLSALQFERAGMAGRAVQSTTGKPRPGRKYGTLDRVKPEHLRAVHEDRRRYQETRQPVPFSTGLQDFRAILHAHAEDSTHTGGTRAELLAAAKRTGVQIVMLSDHVRPPRDFITESWRGLREGVLFIPGAESDGFIVYPTRSIISAHLTKSRRPRPEYIKLVKRDGGNIFLSHAENKPDWETGELDGMEIYNHHADFLDEVGFVLWFRASFANPAQLKQIDQALQEFPMEFFGASQDYPAAVIAKWDRELQLHPLTGVAANDCHHNQVYTIRAAGPETIEVLSVDDPPRPITAQGSPGVTEMLKGRQTGDVIVKLDFDPYERSLSYVTTHLLMPELSESATRRALRQGRAYVAHDWLCDPTGFAFIAEKNGKRTGVMGDQVRLEPGLRLRLAAPNAGWIKLFRNGEVVQELRGAALDFEPTEPGVYRAEVWLELDGEQRPWIYANPIRVVK